jgi:hypothetical protein
MIAQNIARSQNFLRRSISKKLRKRFFSEEKKQKTFIYTPTWVRSSTPPIPRTPSWPGLNRRGRPPAIHAFL